MTFARVARRIFSVLPTLAFVLSDGSTRVESATSSTAGNPARPNLVFILADDLGWKDTSLYGSTFYETPNLERLARRGMMFMNAYAANPLCSPTRASILTGLYPARIGITAPACHLPLERLEARVAATARPDQKALVVSSATRLSTNYFTLAEALRDAGCHWGEQPPLVEVGDWPALMICTSTPSSASAAFPQDAAQAHAGPLVQRSERALVAVLEVLKPAAQHRVQLGDGRFQALPVRSLRVAPHRVLQLLDALQDPINFLYPQVELDGHVHQLYRQAPTNFDDLILSTF